VTALPRRILQFVRSLLTQGIVKRSWNWSLWVGFVFALAGFISYEFFVRFPITRDFPWANLLLFGTAGFFLVKGLARAYGNPTRYRGRIFGPILTTMALLIFALFSYALFYVVRQMPSSTGAPRLGQKAPEFTLPDQNGKSVALSDLISSNGARGALLIFYRGYW
jgi:hypothetical protein